MTINQLLESELHSLLDYLFESCDNPLEIASSDIQELFAPTALDDYDIRDCLEQSYKHAFWNSSPPSATPFTIWLDVSGLELPEEFIEPDELDDFTISGDYGYYYIGYGLTAYFDPDKLRSAIADKVGAA